MPDVVARAPISRKSGTTPKPRSVAVRIGDCATILSAGFQPVSEPKPTTPTMPMAMPIGTRSNMRTKSEAKPTMATRSVLIGASVDRRRVALRNADPGAEGNGDGSYHKKQNCGGQTDPGKQKEGPGRRTH